MPAKKLLTKEPLKFGQRINLIKIANNGEEPGTGTPANTFLPLIQMSNNFDQLQFCPYLT